MKKLVIFTIFTIFTILNFVYFAQSKEDLICGMTTLSAGRFKPASTLNDSYMRVLIVFAQISDDLEQSNNWPLNQLPIWANDFIDDTKKENYSAKTISDYFHEVSKQTLDFIGDVYQDTIIVPSGLSYGASNLFVINELNDSISDFTRYDNWKYENNEFVFSESNGDGYLDMLIIIYRNADHFGNWTAIATLNLLTDFVTHDGITIKSGFFPSTPTSKIAGITVKKTLQSGFRYIEIIAHEYGHYLFGSGHSNMGGLMPGEPYINAGSTSTFMMNTWEREWLGYINYIVPTLDGEQITIGDFVSSGDAIKIPIPFNDQSSSTFFIIENHQRLSDYDQIMRGGQLEGQYTFGTSLGNGIYIWKVTSGDSWPPTIDIRTADGAWDWALNGTIDMPTGWPSTMPLTIRSDIDKDNGRSDRHPDNIEWNGIHWEKWHDIDPTTKEYALTRNVMGDEYDAFNKDYNELFTPWSNPSSYAGGVTNISVELVSEDPSGNITLKVYSTEASAEALPPSKPQGLSVENETSIDFGDNYTATSQLEWFSNDEPDLDYYKVYKATTTGSAPSLNEYAFVCTTEVNSIELPITDFGDNTKIYYRITAVDTEGKESVKSEGNWDWVPPTPPVNIQKLTQNNHPKIAWDPKTNVTNPTYSVYRMKRTDFPGMWESIATISGTSYVDLQIDLPNQQYANMDNVYYKVIVIRDGKLSSDFSTSINYRIEGSGWVIKKEGNEEAIPDVFAISQNYPNPFNPTTVIKYQLPESVNVTIKLYDMLGREVKEFLNDTQEAGYYELNFDGSDLSSGTYIYRITAGDFTDSKKLLLLK